MTRSRSLVLTVLAVLCAIGGATAVSDQFAILGIDRGVGAVGTFRAPVGQPVIANAGSADVPWSDSMAVAGIAGPPSSLPSGPYAGDWPTAPTTVSATILQRHLLDD